MRKPDIINEIVKQLCLIDEIEQIILFGSRARGDAGERADIDIAIEAPLADQTCWSEILEILDNSDTLLIFDVVRLDEASDVLRDRISTEGKALYERSKKSAKLT